MVLIFPLFFYFYLRNFTRRRFLRASAFWGWSPVPGGLLGSIFPKKTSDLWMNGDVLAFPKGVTTQKAMGQKREALYKDHRFWFIFPFTNRGFKFKYPVFLTHSHRRSSFKGYLRYPLQKDAKITLITKTTSDLKQITAKTNTSNKL